MRQTLSFIVYFLIALSGGGAYEAQQLSRRAIFLKPIATTIDPERQSTREIVVKFHEGTHIRLRSGLLAFDPAALTNDGRMRLARHELTEEIVRADVGRANTLLFQGVQGTVAPLFARGEGELELERAEYQSVAGVELADLNLYLMLVLHQPDQTVAEKTIDGLNALRSVEISYAEPLPANPPADIPPITTITPALDQGYLRRASEGGIDAGWAGRLAGGRGAGIRVIDLETGWDKDHEDLPGSYFAEHGWNFAEGSHGAAVLGVLAAADNGYGATGIVPDVALGLSSPIWSTWYSPHNTAAAVDNAASHLPKGDILVVEQHYPEPLPPGAMCSQNVTQCGFLPMEGVQAVFDAIGLAATKGIIVVEAAGNGSMNLDDPFYGGRFDRILRDSGAIMVGAGVPNSRDAKPWSNFGSRVDLQGWGSGVATLGFGPDPSLRANGNDARQWYTRSFSGTSSATPIVAGAAAAVNGYRLAHGDPLMSAIEMRMWLRLTGTEQPTLNASTNQIGPLPDLRRAIQAVGGVLDDVRYGGYALGWAFHSGHPADSIDVHFYVDGPGGTGNWGGGATTNVNRPDVNSAYGIGGAHGFQYRIPDAFRDDANHTLFAHGVDPTGLQQVVLLDNQIVFTLPNVQGAVVSVDPNGRVQGWAYAAQSASQSVTVHAYVDGTFAVGSPANISLPWVNSAYGIKGSHGFDFKLPSAYRDGKLHTLEVYGIDPRNKNNPLLSRRQVQLNLLPAPRLTPATADFGQRAVGSKTVLTATLSNGGPGSLDVGLMSISNGPSVATTTCGTILAAGKSCAYDVVYQPTSTVESSASMSVETPNAAASSVGIAIKGGGMPVPYNVQNLALSPNAVASQSSTAQILCNGLLPTASRAVDGNTSGDWSKCSVTHTSGLEANAYWQVDLGSRRYIDHVNVWNRTDCCATRLRNYELLVSDSPLGPWQDYYQAGVAGSPTTVQVVRYGRFVRVRQRTQDYLHLAEVEVFGY